MSHVGKSVLAFAVILLMRLGVADGQTTTRVSVDSAGVQATGSSYNPSLSDDGRFVAFWSYAANLVPADTNGTADVFVHDRQTGRTTLATVDSAGVQGNSGGALPSISADGRFVAFSSNSTNLVPGDTGFWRDVFVHDRQSGQTTSVSMDSAGFQGNDGSNLPSISGDGRFVAFESYSTNLVLGDSNNALDVFVHDRETGQTARMSVDSAGAQANEFSRENSISSDGAFVAFTSFATNLVAGDANGSSDVFVHDRQSGSTTRVSVDTAGGEANGPSYSPSISGDGRFVAFVSAGSNLVLGDTNGSPDVFIHDRQTGLTSRASVNSAGVEGEANSESPSISRDGRFVAFNSYAGNLVPRRNGALFHVFVHDVQTGQTTLASVDSAGVEGNFISGYPNTFAALSRDGHIVAFNSFATNLIAGDTNDAVDIFVRELPDPAACRAGTVNSGLGLTTEVLSVNGSAGDANRVVTVPTNSSFTVALHAAPTGPGGPGDPVARYVVWVWPGFPSNPFNLASGAQGISCLVNPTPFRPLASPQPLRCLRGTGLPSRADACLNVTMRQAPARAPWTLISRGVATPIVVTLQGLLEDLGASNSRHFSATNAVIVVIQ